MVSFCADKGRYRVRLDGRDTALGLKPGNLEKEGSDDLGYIFNDLAEKCRPAWDHDGRRVVSTLRDTFAL